MKFWFLKSFFLAGNGRKPVKRPDFKHFFNSRVHIQCWGIQIRPESKNQYWGVPRRGLDIQIPPKNRTKTVFCKNHGRFWPDPAQILHGVILWYSPQLILDLARSQKSVVYLGGGFECNPCVISARMALRIRISLWKLVWILLGRSIFLKLKKKLKK